MVSSSVVVISVLWTLLEKFCIRRTSNNHADVCTRMHLKGNIMEQMFWKIIGENLERIYALRF